MRARNSAPLPPRAVPGDYSGTVTTATSDPSLRWRYVVAEPMDGARNMAWDQALMARARRTGEAVLRVYAWTRPTLSLGRNQSARGAYDLDRAGHLGVDFVRRPTGGRALLHHREVTYSVTAPDRFDATLSGAYARINRLLLAALHALDVPAELARPVRRTPSPGLSPCFDEPAAGEIVVAGRKLVGSAQWRHNGALLQHGSILLADDQGLIAELLRSRPRTGTPPAATLAAILGDAPPFGRVADALVTALRRTAAAATPLAVDATLANDVDRAAEEFRDEAWTWRR